MLLYYIYVVNKQKILFIYFMEKKVENSIKKLIQKENKNYSKYFYPLLENAFSKEDLIAGIKVITSGKLTMSEKTRRFEKNNCSIGKTL